MGGQFTNCNTEKFLALNIDEKRTMLNKVYTKEDAKQSKICAEGYKDFMERLSATGEAPDGLLLTLLAKDLHELEAVCRLFLGENATFYGEVSTEE